MKKTSHQLNQIHRKLPRLFVNERHRIRNRSPTRRTVRPPITIHRRRLFVNGRHRICHRIPTRRAPRPPTTIHRHRRRPLGNLNVLLSLRLVGHFVFVLKMPLQIVRSHRLDVRALRYRALETGLLIVSARGPYVPPIVGNGILWTSLEVQRA